MTDFTWQSAPEINCQAPPSLSDVLTYRNADVINKFLEHFEMTFEEAEDLFNETLKWMWLCARDEIPPLFITHDLQILDEMWHTFILFTQDYAAFCDHYLGQFIHHAPTTKAEKVQAQQQCVEDPETFQRARRDELRTELTFIAKHLGSQTVLKWFVDYPRHYGPEFFERAARRPVSMFSPELLAGLNQLADRFASANRSAYHQPTTVHG